MDYLPIIGIISGTVASVYTYSMALRKGVKDLSENKDTFFSRALIPYLNNTLRKHNKSPITTEEEFDNFLTMFDKYRFESNLGNLEDKVKEANN